MAYLELQRVKRKPSENSSVKLYVGAKYYILQNTQFISNVIKEGIEF